MMPEENKKYWAEKIRRNRERDKIVNSHYRKVNWKILRIWEHEFKNLEKNKDKIKSLARV